MQKGFTPILILVGVLILAIVAGGAYYFSKSQISQPQSSNPPVVSQTPQPTSVSSSTPDETANWKTYTGKDYTFKYPSNGDILTDRSSDVYISANTKSYFTFTVKTENNLNHLSTKQAIDKMVTNLRNNKEAPWAKSQADQTLRTMKEYTNGQITGIKLQSFDEGYPQKFGEVVEATEDKIYTFHISDGSGGGVGEDDEKLFDKILSTFKFLPTTADGDQNTKLKVYKNEKYGFEVSYPSDMLLGSEPQAPDSELLSSRSIYRPEAQDSIGKGKIDIAVRSTPLDVLISSAKSLAGSNVAKVSVRGIEASKLDWIENGRSDGIKLYTLKVFFSKNDFSYIISLYIDNTSPSKQDLVQVFNQVLSTFKFTQ